MITGDTYRTVRARALQRERFRHHFAEHDVQISQEADRDDARQRVSRDPAVCSNGSRRTAIHSASTCSPYMPSPRLATEMPTCVVAM